MVRAERRLVVAARVAKPVDARDLKSLGIRSHAGSIPAPSTLRLRRILVVNNWHRELRQEWREAQACRRRARGMMAVVVTGRLLPAPLPLTAASRLIDS